MENLFNEYLAENGESSFSQNNQDKLVLSLLGESPGFFVEFGADDGVTLSNTFLLEKDFNWKGIVCEPSIVSREKLIASRDCYIDLNCVTDKSGEVVSFIETGRGLSSIEKYAYDDMWADTRKEGYSYEVPTISLSDLLDKYNAPYEIDYISLDVEGSEIYILQDFLPNNKRKIFNWTIEVNPGEPNEAAILNWMKSYNYTLIEKNGLNGRLGHDYLFTYKN